MKYPIEIGQIRKCKGTGRYYLVVGEENDKLKIKGVNTRLVEYEGEMKRSNRAVDVIERDQFMIRQTNRRKKYGW